MLGCKCINKINPEKTSFQNLILLNIFLTLLKLILTLFIIMKKLPVICPSCTQELAVEKLVCNNCETQVVGNYELPLFLKLSVEEQNFIMQFFLNSGSLKDMAKQMDVSYPTMRNKVDDLIHKINTRSDE